MKILLVGNPNAGKSTLFNLLTGAHEKVGNWHGGTVVAAEREAELGGRKVTLGDLPGIYTMDSMSMEEK
ncbi:MAG: 50S ribosome-binding GTPase, partial [Clostridia bacterium]|nr:50S ribosome-binding GTPase [Clostridia bacterium]